MPHKTQKSTIGKLGEKLALKFLIQKGYQFVAANYYIRGGEIDLIVKKNGILIFVEVKTRTQTTFGEGEEAITRAKKQKLLKTIFTYLQERSPHNWQLDAISITLNQGKAFIKHFQNILVV